MNFRFSVSFLFFPELKDIAGLLMKDYFSDFWEADLLPDLSAEYGHLKVQGAVSTVQHP